MTCQVRVGIISVCWIGLLGLSGCGMRSELNTEYGLRDAGWGRASVNGTGLLAKMYEDSGRPVSSWRRLSRRLERCDTIVLFPRDIQAPTAEQVAFLDSWLSGGYQRTLIYVGPGYDAAPDYWGDVRRSITGPDRLEAHRRQIASRLESWYFSAWRWSNLGRTSCDWFDMEGAGFETRGGTVSGTWSTAVSSQTIDLPRATKLTHNKPQGDEFEEHSYEVLLALDEIPFAWRYVSGRWPEGQLVVVTNGAFLMNYPLTRPENQRLARRLVDLSAPDGRVVFLETGIGGPMVSEVSETPLSGLAALADLPLGPILVQWLLVGMLYCLSVFPIFGRGRKPPEPLPADFGEHVAALAELLSRTGDVEFARQRVRHFRQLSGLGDELPVTGNPFGNSRESRKEDSE